MDYKDYSLPYTHLDDLATPIHVSDDINTTCDLSKLRLTKAEENLSDVKTETTNSAVAYSTTLSSCLDYFFHVYDECETNRLEELIEAAWKEDANATLRLIFQLRDIRDGKGVKKQFLYSLDWLRQHHFQTLLYNLQYVAQVGCWKDLLDLLVVQVLGAEGFKKREEAEKRKICSNTRLSEIRKALKKKETATLTKGWAKIFEPQAKIDKVQAAINARQLFTEDEKYQRLHVRVAALFAEQLKTDLAHMKENKRVSLAAKWAPTACRHHDKLTLVVSTISQLLFKQSDLRKDKSYVSYVSTARNLYRKNYVSPLRAYLKVTERYMSENKWEDIPYDKVPSKCMMRNKTHFKDRDTDRFQKYLDDVAAGTKTIKSSALNPHEMVQQVSSMNLELSEMELQTVQLQWDAYVSKLREQGSLGSCMAMCDVSGSMTWTYVKNGPMPMTVAISLSLLVSELAAEPFKGLLLTFSSTPEFFSVPEGPLEAKAEATRGMNGGYNTNVDAAFDLILRRPSRIMSPPRI